MATFGIHFVNETGSTGKYALLTQPPTTTSTTGSAGTCYSNVFMTNTLANDGDWTITVNKTYYAWCGTAPTQFAPGVVVQSGMGKPVTLGTATAPGTTWTVYNLDNKPAFDQNPTLTSKASAFEIDTKTDFTAQQNFIIGMGNPDSNGIMRPVATMAAKPNFNVNFTPINRYWIGAFDSTVGTVFDTTSVSGTLADINFSANPGMYGAIVRQDPFGKWSVSYVNQLSFAFEVILSQSKLRGTAWLIDALKAQCDVVQGNLLEAGSGSGASVFGNSDRYIGEVAILGYRYSWEDFRNAIADKFPTGWHYEGGTLSTDGLKVRITFSHEQPSTLEGARAAFTEARDGLTDAMKASFVDPSVIPYGTVANTQSTSIDVAATRQLQQSQQQRLQPQRFQGAPMQSFGEGNYVATAA